MNETVGVVLGGGKGSRLFPLTTVRSKPAVPLAAKYRLIDIPISNCINSGILRIFVLTQYNSASLNSHIKMTYQMGMFSRGFVDILAAEQTPDSSGWFQGTADAVRQSLKHILTLRIDYLLVLSGDQLYRMDFSDVVRTHKEKSAEITICTLPVEASRASGFGLMSVEEDGRIASFHEKPSNPEVIEKLVRDCRSLRPDGKDRALASMGIYLFNRDVLVESLQDESKIDFGRDVIPAALAEHRVYAHVFDGYWEDIGTIGAFYKANIKLTSEDSPFDFYDADAPIYTHPRFLPASWIGGGRIENCIIADGCVVKGRKICHSIIGIRSIIGEGVEMYNSLMMGADYFETDSDAEVPVGIGAGSIIRNAILAKNARVGKEVRIENRSRTRQFDGDNYFVREGIVIVPKNAAIPDRTII